MSEPVSRAEPRFPEPHFAEPKVEVERRRDGALILRSAHELGPYPRCLGELLLANARRWPDRTFLGERSAEQGLDGPWRTVTWAEALEWVRKLADALLERGATAERPLLLLSGNSIAHALMTLAAMHVGVPAVPVSVAYSLVSRDFNPTTAASRPARDAGGPTGCSDLDLRFNPTTAASRPARDAGGPTGCSDLDLRFSKLRRIAERVTPGVVFVEQREPFAAALAAAGLDQLPLLTGFASADFQALARTQPRPEVERRFAALGPDTIAKILFTSGSTGLPKGVINTQRMLCSNQAALARVWPFLIEQREAGDPPVICDWLPWNHTFGANFNFNLILMHGGTLWIDGGKPAPGLFATTVANLREWAPTLYFNVPRGFELLVPELERDAELREHFFSRLDLVFYAAAALPQNLWTRLEQLSLQARGRRVAMVSAWGSTETAPCSTAVHWPIERAGVIGNPMPGTEIALVRNQEKLELRVRGPNVTPGYWRDPELSAAAFDEHGFYRIGDAGKLFDPEHPERGIVFDGRVSEDFKLSSGTWVHVGELRLAVITACEPLIVDCVIAGHDRAELGVLVFPNLTACRALAQLDESATPEQIAADPRVRAAIARGLAEHNLAHPGTSTRFVHALIEVEPPSIDADEITDKGYINQRAVLSVRASSVARLYSQDPAAIRVGG